MPSYFDRTLAVPRAPAVQFPLSVGGVVALAIGTHAAAPELVTQVGAAAWFAGLLVWVGALGWTVRDNLTGGETGTGDHQAERRPVDRASNAAVPVVAGYLLVGSYELLAAAVGLPTLLAGAPARVSHLLGAGGAALLVFAVGFRLFPRFLVAHPPRVLVAAVLVAVFAGVAALALAGHLVFAERHPAVVTLHYRFALAVVGLVTAGLILQVGGLVVPVAATLGEAAVLAGTIGYAYLLASAFVARG